MKGLFNEYSILLLCFICSIIGFSILHEFILNSNGLHEVIIHLLYGVV